MYVDMGFISFFLRVQTSQTDDSSDDAWEKQEGLILIKRCFRDSQISSRLQWKEEWKEPRCTWWLQQV